MTKEELESAIEKQEQILKDTKYYLDNLKEEVSKLKDEEDYTPVNWKPKDGENGYFANSWLNVVNIVFFENGDQKQILKYNRIFKTEEECKKYCEIQIAFREKARPFIYNEKNFILRYKQETSEILISTLYFDQFDTLHFERNDLKELMKRFSKSDIKRYYLNIDD